MFPSETLRKIFSRGEKINLIKIKPDNCRVRRLGDPFEWLKIILISIIKANAKIASLREGGGIFARK